jgi:hypothetical protein
MHTLFCKVTKKGLCHEGRKPPIETRKQSVRGKLPAQKRKNGKWLFLQETIAILGITHLSRFHLETESKPWVICRTVSYNNTPSSQTYRSSRMASSRMLRRVALVRTDVSEELSASIISVTSIGELGTTLAVLSNRRKLRRNTK